jgi:hypothetical protein
MSRVLSLLNLLAIFVGLPDFHSAENNLSCRRPPEEMTEEDNRRFAAHAAVPNRLAFVEYLLKIRPLAYVDIS